MLSLQQRNSTDPKNEQRPQALLSFKRRRFAECPPGLKSSPREKSRVQGAVNEIKKSQGKKLPSEQK